MTAYHILASGCSFTQNGIGGVPPSDSHPEGACSFVDTGDFVPADPMSWVGMVAKKLQCKSLVNFASSGHGNILVAMTLIEALIKYPSYQPDNTLVLFNLSDPGRLDVLCPTTHPDKSMCTPWDESLLPLSFLSPNSKSTETVHKIMGIEQVEVATQHAVLALLNLLEHRKFNYRYTMMRNYLDHSGMASILKDYQHNLISLPGGSMEEYCKMNNLTISENDTHPNLQGHAAIAEIVYNNIVATI